MKTPPPGGVFICTMTTTGTYVLYRIQSAATLLIALCAGWMLSGVDAPFSWQTRYDEARVLQCLVLATLLITIAFRSDTVLRTINEYKPIWIGSLLAALLLGCLSAARSDLPGYAFIEISFWLASALSIAAIQSNAEPTFRRLILLIVAGGAMALGLRFATEYTAAIVNRDPRGLESSWAPFINPRYFAKVATLALPLLWLAPRLSRNRSSALKFGAFAAAIMIWSQLIGSGSRGALLGMAMSIAMAILLMGQIGRRYGVYQIGTATAGTLLWASFVWAGGVTAPERITNGGWSGREALYQAAIEDILQAPLLGIGPMQYARLGQHPDTAVAGPHNFPLQLAAEWGLPAATILLLTLGAGLWTLVRAARLSSLTADVEGEGSIRIAIVCAIAAAAVHGIFANVANEPISQTVLVLLAGAFPCKSVASGTKAAISTSSRSARLLVVIFAAGSCAGVAGTVVDGWSCFSNPGLNTYSVGAGGVVYPRLWSQGLIPLSQSCRTANPLGPS